MMRKACRFKLVAQTARLPIRLFGRNQSIEPDFQQYQFLLKDVFGLPFALDGRHSVERQRFAVRLSVSLPVQYEQLYGTL
jgi:hypothetical protein